MKKMFFSLLVLALALSMTAGIAAQADPYSYNPTAEEDNSTAYIPGAVYDAYGNQVNVGATPIPLDPIDLPTPTPRPSLQFQYGMVSADKLGISFEAPTGWYVDSSANDTIVLTDPNMYDNVNATFTISMQNVSKDYKLADVKEEVLAILKNVGQYNYSEWEKTELNKRTLLGKDGYYADYRGVLFDGTIIRGRVMVALLDGNKIITVHMKAPGWHNEDYKNVVAHFRDTLKSK